MIKIDWKNAKKETPICEVTPGFKYTSVEMPHCLVSDGVEVWEELYDPTEGFHESVLKFIEFKSITP